MLMSIMIVLYMMQLMDNKELTSYNKLVILINWLQLYTHKIDYILHANISPYIYKRIPRKYVPIITYSLSPKPTQ